MAEGCRNGVLQDFHRASRKAEEAGILLTFCLVFILRKKKVFSTLH